MDSTSFDTKRIAEGYKKRPYLHKQVIEKFQEIIIKTNFKRGLDVGCGAGLSTKALKDICDFVIGTDISPEMIKVAKEVCNEDANIKYMVSKAEKISLEEKVDVVTAAGVVQWIEKDIFLDNMKNLLHINGFLLIYDFAISDKMLQCPAYTEWWHNEYLKEFPKPYRNEHQWEEKDVLPYGFRMLKQVLLNMEYDFTLSSFIEFMMIQSNVNIKIESGEKTVESVYNWFEKTLSEIFRNSKKTVMFHGYLWCIKKAE